MRKKLIATLLMVAAITTACGAGPAQASDPPGRPTGVSAEVQWGQVVIEWDSPADPGVTHTGYTGRQSGRRRRWPGKRTVRRRRPSRTRERKGEKPTPTG